MDARDLKAAGEVYSKIPTGIYKITNTVNEKFYIGSAINIKNRWRTHKNKLKSNNHDNSYLQNACNIYGINSFIFSMVEYCENETLLEREQYWLDLLTPYDRAIGYNIAKVAGSQLGFEHSEQTKKLMSEVHRLRLSKLTDEEKEVYKHYGNDYKKGIPNSTETRKRMSLAAKGKPKSEAHKLAISLAHKGKKKSPEHMAKIIASRKANAEKKANEQF